MNKRASLLNSIVNRKRKSLRRLPFYVIIDNLKRQNSDRLAALREVERILLDHGHKQSLYGLARYFESKRESYKNSYEGVDKKFGLAANCCHKLDIELKNIQHGVDAEHVLFKHVHTFHNSNSAVLKNLSLYVDDFPSETDSLLILPTGIFLIDAKYRSVLTTSGMEDFAKIERQKVNIRHTLLSDEELTSNVRVRNALENHLHAAIYDHKANIVAEDCELAVPILSSEMAILRFVLDKKA